MNLRATPLRLRLLVLILVPLAIIAAIAGFWRFSVAKKTSEEIFDRTLVALTLAVSRDVAITGGDALSTATFDLMRQAAGGEVFYHVHGPDGVFVTGYAYPPTNRLRAPKKVGVPVLFESSYKGVKVRVSQLTEKSDLDGIAGFSTVTVWQTKHARDVFARDLAIRAAIVMGLLVLAVAALVWFGINLGLKPLEDLQDAISKRTSDDLSTIRRDVPQEVTGLVRTLNFLFQEVSNSIASRDRFISDAAHQLRNPIAGLRSLAEATRDSPDEAHSKARAGEMVEAARHASRLAEQLLSYEKIRAGTGDRQFQRADLNVIVEEVCVRNAKRVMEAGIDFSFTEFPEPIPVHCNSILLSEAVENLIDNALVHGGPGNKSISVRLEKNVSSALIVVEDAGRGIDAEDRQRVFDRFAQATPSEGSGLGLSIVDEIVRIHQGAVKLGDGAGGKGLRVELALPLAEAAAKSGQ